jgi:hypothetical protein
MSKFNVGDTVVIVGVTDLDGDFVEAGTQITDPKHEATMDWRNPPQTLIGQIGVVMEAAMNDYYDITVQFDWNAKEIPSVVGGAPGYEGLSFKEQDAEKVLGYKVIGTIPTPMSNPRRTAFDHHPSTEPGGKPVQIGEAGHTVEVTTESEAVADQLASVFEKVYNDVEIEVVV